MKHITKYQLVEKIKDCKGSTFITIDTEVEPKMNKRGNPFLGRVKKLSKVNGIINFNYEDSVNAQLVKEGKVADFEAHRHAWGDREGAIRTHRKNGRQYLIVKIQKNLTDPIYMVDGIPVDPDKYKEEGELLRKWLPKKRSVKSQGTDTEIVERDYAFESIKAARLKGESFRIDD